MLTRTHFVIALLVIILSLPLNGFFIGGFIVATFFVDIDSKKSKMGNHWYLRPLQWVTRHRGIFHSLLFALIISALIYSINIPFATGFFFGYLLHLALDCLTTQGCKLFWPFDFKLSFFVRSGGLLEEIIFVLVLLADIFYLGKIFF